MNGPIVRLSFRYSENDFIRAMRAHYASILRLWLDVCVVILGVVTSVSLWNYPTWHWLSITLLCITAIFALLLVSAFTVIPIMVFRRDPKFRDEYALTFSQEGIHFTTAHIDSQLQWGLYSKALVDPHSYVLYYGVRSFTIIPKRAFQDMTQQSAFEQLLVEHIPKIVRKK